MFVCLFVCMFVCLFVLFVSLFVCLFVCLFSINIYIISRYEFSPGDPPYLSGLTSPSV